MSSHPTRDDDAVRADAAPAPRRGLRRAADLALASHPGPTVVVTAFSLAMAAGAGASAPVTALVGAAILSGQLSIGWSNDWVDAGRDAAVGRTDKPVGTGRLPVSTVRAAALAAAAACVLLSLALGWRAGLVHLATVASAWAYNLRLKSTVWSWAPYAFSFGFLPMAIALALPGAPVAAWWAVGAGALLGIGAHGANVVPDLQDDRATGVRGLPHRVGGTVTSIGSALALLSATLLVVLAPAGPPSAAAAAVLVAAVGLTIAGTVLALSGGRSRLPFAFAMAVAAVDVVLLVLSDWVR
ncbi:UbiA family prenyltransferase [Cellulomonas fengjieae]|uniref:UbiA family prenyltransferase n=1 Tax=Cellulomonas fengjieae TaxID=2819978 RepID=A0ABS3SG49_9CELL|nr:UbiA family prenyltransferase [Cellulomonas fengjieae]MBO3084632.1 UbiA family prenyltransferase [Cellulomonas fengjieae]QVI67043.1 UbiA family prenyltransferase [Cellulomonas fengjieae]